MTIGTLTLRESVEFSTQTSTSGEQLRTVSVHTRAIGSRVYQVREVAGRPGEKGQPRTTVNTTLSDGEVENFEADWAVLWKPEIEIGELDRLDEKKLEYDPLNV